MKFKHAIAAALMAVVASSSFADTALSGGGYGDASHPFTFTFDATGYNTLLLDFYSSSAAVHSVSLDTTALSYNTGSNSWQFSGTIGAGTHNLQTTFNSAAGFGLSGALSTSNVAPNAGSAAGMSSGSGGTVVTSVPEPESYAMMLAGLGVLGFIGRRRKQK